MAFKSKIVKPLANKISRDIDKWSRTAVESQQKILKNLIKKASHTQFGQDHQFSKIKTYEDFKSLVPIRDYEQIKPYVQKIIDGQADVLWKGKPKYFAKTSGTTSGVKYIPLTKDSIPNHFGTARNALFNYYAKTGQGAWLDGKMIFLSGSPEMTKTSGILTGRLSGIVNHQVPQWIRKNQLPSYETNCIEAWEEKLERIVEETIDQDMRLISGIPPWVQMYYEKLLEKSGKSTISNLFPNYEVFVFGGVNYKPYQATLEKLVGKQINTLETYPASEGFIAFQDQLGAEGLLLNSNSGIFFEFVLAEDIFDDNPKRINLSEVEIGKNYAIILSTNAGLWAYNIGDTVEFVSLDPFRLKVSGRIKHFISAFGEHVIGKEVEKAMEEACKECNVRVIEFSVAPQVNPNAGLPFHEWLIEFEDAPTSIGLFAKILDQKMVAQNIYYKDLISGKVLQPLIITEIKKDGFRSMMQARGKLGGQNKVPRLANDRVLAEDMQGFHKNKTG